MDLSASLALPSDGPSEVSVTPALDLSGLDQVDWRDRLVIEHIALNLEDVRLLGADPRIPSGGLDLLDRPRVIASDGRVGAAIRLPFPDSFVGGEDLAVFLRVGPSEVLEGVSVEVYARLYTSVPITANASQLSAVDPDVDPAQPAEGEPAGAVDPDVDPAQPKDEDPPPDSRSDGGATHQGAVDPDVDPARPQDETEGVVDPDVDPARPDDGEDEGGAVDPDVDPAHGSSSSALVERASEDVPSVAFVLRDDQAADMVATLGAESKLDVVVGIPAARWFTPAIVDALEQALATAEQGTGVVSALEAVGLSAWSDAGEPGPVFDARSGVIEIRRSVVEEVAADPGESFFLTSEAIERNRLD